MDGLHVHHHHPWEFHFGSFFGTAKKSKSKHNYPILGFVGHNEPESDPPGPPKGDNIS
jgi:hypothetical protein